MLLDARDIPQDTALDFDLCIVGAGPAGIAIADRLRGNGLHVCLLESGGFEPELASQRLFRGENVGHSYYRLDGCRFRLFGGSTNRWGGWCRPLDPFDFERREWVAWSGWPIGYDALRDYCGAAAELFQLPNAHFDLSAWSAQLPEPYPMHGGDFQNTVFQYSPETNFGAEYRRVLSAPDVTTLLHATVTDMRLEAGTNRIETLRVQALGRRAFSVRGRAIVVAAGGIENARLLLAARAERPAGLGNEHDLVGRFFMEHLHVPAGHFAPQGAAIARDFYRKRNDGLKVRGVITPTPAAQCEYRLLTGSIAVEPSYYAYGTPYIGWPPAVTFGPILAYRKLRALSASLGAESIKSTFEKAYGIPRRLQTWRTAREALARIPDAVRADTQTVHSLYFRTEQAPNPASRVSLGDRRDALGVPQVRLDWRIGATDTDSILGWLRRLDAHFSENGLGRVIMPAAGWQDRIIGGPHHMGTTRMSADAKTGVVDEHCRVHSVDNLYVAGSSVFATGGYANPTFTLVALALRLADRLLQRLR